MLRRGGGIHAVFVATNIVLPSSVSLRRMMMLIIADFIRQSHPIVDNHGIDGFI